MGCVVQKNESKWTFLSNHSHVILLLAQNPELTLREVAQQINITERAVQGIVADLEEEGYLVKYRQGRQNRYQIYPDMHLRHQLEAHCTIGDLIHLIHPADSAN